MLSEIQKMRAIDRLTSESAMARSIRQLFRLGWTTPIVIGLGLVVSLAILKGEAEKIPFIYNSGQ